MFLVKPVSVSADSGKEVTLECLVDGNAITDDKQVGPSYTWFRNGDMETVRILRQSKYS